MDLTIIAVTHNSHGAIQELFACLDADLRAQVLIIDNASSDGTAEFARDQGVHVIRNSRNHGFARAANAGANAASTGTLCFLNPDCRPNHQIFMEGLRAVGSESPNCAVPSLNEPGGATLSGQQPGYTRLKLVADAILTNYGAIPLWHWLRNCRDYDDPTWTWPHGACLFVARDFFLRLGGFNERYFLYMEDVDFGKRLHDAGGRIVTLQCTLDHGRGKGSSIHRMRRLALLNMGRIRYASEVYGNMLALTLGLIALPGFTVKGLLGMRK